MGSNQISYARISDLGKVSDLTFSLPSDHQIKKITTQTGNRTSGKYRCAINQFGISESFGIQITDGSQEKWIVVAGGTGQSKTYENESQFSIPNAQLAP